MQIYKDYELTKFWKLTAGQPFFHKDCFCMKLKVAKGEMGPNVVNLESGELIFVGDNDEVNYKPHAVILPDIHSVVVNLKRS